MVAISGRFHNVQALQRELLLIDRRVDRATMYSLREAGRRTKKVAMKYAPVWRGAGITRKQQRTGPLVVSRGAPVKGLLRASIHSSKRLKKHGPGAYGVGVAPRGQRVHLYSGKAESRHHFMHRAHDEVSPQLRSIATLAYARATRR